MVMGRAGVEQAQGLARGLAWGLLCEGVWCGSVCVAAASLGAGARWWACVGIGVRVGLRARVGTGCGYGWGCMYMAAAGLLACGARREGARDWVRADVHGSCGIGSWHVGISECVGLRGRIGLRGLHCHLGRPRGVHGDTGRVCGERAWAGGR